ncbi:MAG: glycosyltransferase [Parabacteroides sp.]
MDLRGRLVKDKGIIELVEAFSILQEKYSNIRLLLVGMLEERDALPKNIIESIIKNPNIITTGYISNSFIEYYYALMNIFILLSYREGFPTSVLEASAMELPVITTRVTGCIDSIIENRTGVFVSHNVQEISSIIERFYINRQLGVVYGKNGRSLVEQNFRQELIWNEIEKLYRIKSEVDIQ